MEPYYLLPSYLSNFPFLWGKNLSCCITSCGAATNCTRRSDKYHHKVIQCEFRDHIKTRHTVSPFLQHPCREASQAQKGCWIWRSFGSSGGVPFPIALPSYRVSMTANQVGESSCLDVMPAIYSCLGRPGALTLEGSWGPWVVLDDTVLQPWEGQSSSHGKEAIFPLGSWTRALPIQLVRALG